MPDLPSHPFGALERAGVAVTVNTDDPALFSTRLTDEYLRVAGAFGYDARRLAELSLGALDHAFLPPADRERLGAGFRDDIEDIFEGASDE